MANKRPQKNDVTEIENTFQNLAEKNAMKKQEKMARSANKKKALIIGIICSALVIAIAIPVCYFFVSQYLHDNAVINANLSIAGIHVTGMTRKEAEQAIADTATSALAEKTMTVKVDEHVVQIPASTAGITLNVQAAVDAAVNYEQSGAAVQSLDLTPFMTINKNAIIAQLSPLSAHYDSTLVQHTYETVGEIPVDVTVLDETLQLHTLKITLGFPGIALDVDALYQMVTDAYNECIFEVNYSVIHTEPDPLDMNAIYAELSKQPVNAVMDPETFEITGGFYGYDFDIEAANAAFAQATYGDIIEIPFNWIAPEITAEQAGEMLFRDVLASCTTKTLSSTNRQINLRLACQGINGMIIYPGETFSFNAALGERTVEKGYKPATAYINGESVQDVGGGICQVASTLYYCTVVADMKIVERWAHGYYSDYLPQSTDATVFWGGLDFKFKNNWEYPIRIEATASYGNVTIKLYGTDTKDYYVKFISEVMTETPSEEVYKEYLVDNEEGYKDGEVIVTPYTGYTSKSYRVKYSKETNRKISTTLENSDRYGVRNKVICKIVDEITDPNAPPQPETTVKPSEPENTTTPTEPENTTKPTEPENTTKPTEPENTTKPTETTQESNEGAQE